MTTPLRVRKVKFIHFYSTLTAIEALIEDIKTDISIAKEALSRTPYSQFYDLDGSQSLPDQNAKHE